MLCGGGYNDIDNFFIIISYIMNALIINGEPIK